MHSNCLKDRDECHTPHPTTPTLPPPPAPPAVVKCSIELGNYIHLSNYVQKAEATPEGQVRLGWGGGA